MNCIFKFILEAKMVVKLTVTSRFFFLKNLNFVFLRFVEDYHFIFYSVWIKSKQTFLPESGLEMVFEMDFKWYRLL